jgi:hypothetical protein
MSRTELTASIASADIASAGTAKIKVYKPVNNSTSNAMTLMITAPQPVAVSVSPSNAVLTGGESKQFTATVTGTSNMAVTWQASGGSISQTGAFTVPTRTGTYVVEATSVADTTKTAAATVTVAPTSSDDAASFGMHMHAGVISHQPWPSVPFGSQRLWDSEVQWADINTSKGVYNWSELDKWLDAASNHGIELLYTFGRVPAWASSQPFDTTCSYGSGQCDPPNDLNADGTGTNQHWKDFVTAIVTHAGGRIRHWEIWNEPHNAWYWRGTHAQMVRMAKDAREIIKLTDPNAQIVSPAPGIRGAPARNWLIGYLTAGGGNYVDIFAFHGYIQVGGQYPIAEDFVQYLNAYKTTLANFGQSSKPIWDTESSWGRAYKTGFTDQDLQAGFLARSWLLHVSSDVSRFFWYEWNNSETGTLWMPNPNDPSAPGTLLKPGIAYREVHSWLAGSQMTQACAGAADGTWTCALRRSDGTPAMVVWNTAGAKQFTAPALYRQWRNIYGAAQNIPVNGVMTIGYKPILLVP